MTKDKLTVRLGYLAGPLFKHCSETGQTPSDVIRLAIARLLKIKPRPVERGNPTFKKDQSEV